MTRHSHKHPHQPPDPNRPVEITMTDLEAGAVPAEDRRPSTGGGRGAGSIHAAGTPGGGTASGGLAGTNAGDGDPDEVNDLDDALGSGTDDTGGEADHDGPVDAYGGVSGGAAGRTPAGGRAAGGQGGRGLDPGGPHRGDSTVGANPDAKG